MTLHGPAVVGGDSVVYCHSQNQSNSTQQGLSQRITGTVDEEEAPHADISIDGVKISFAEFDEDAKKAE